MAPESGPLTMCYTDLMPTSQTPKAVGQRRVHRLVSTMKSHRLCPISNQEAIMPAHQSTPTLRSVRDLTDEELGRLLSAQGRVLEVEEELGLIPPINMVEDEADNV